MKVKVTYKMSNIEKALWSSAKHFTNEEFEPAACRVQVSGLKPAPKVAVVWDMDCKAQTGLTEAEYQAKHHHAWSD